VVYKGLMLAEQLPSFYRDLEDPRTVSRLALVHSRFSTNTFPTWDRAHPFRLLAHNGEINTLSGNRAWVGAREPLMASDRFAEAISDLKPVLDKMYAETTLSDPKARSEWLNKSVADFQASNDPFIKAAVATYDDMLKREAEEEELAGRLQQAAQVPRHVADQVQGAGQAAASPPGDRAR
jgi:glutamate synthase domain-containing protein 1